MDAEAYIASPGYLRDLDITRAIWSEPTTAGTAGAYVFLIYLSLPVLLDVRSRSGRPARSALDGERERTFLMNITGCAAQDPWRGGIRNPQVRRQARLLGRYHDGFSGMRPEYVDFIGAVIALAPLKARPELRTSAWDRRRQSYWRYMSCALSLLGARLGDEAAARERCLAFVDAHAAPSAEGRRLFKFLYAHHPRYVEWAVSLLPPRAGAAVGDLTTSPAC